MSTTDDYVTQNSTVWSSRLESSWSWITQQCCLPNQSMMLGMGNELKCHCQHDSLWHFQLPGQTQRFLRKFELSHILGYSLSLCLSFKKNNMFLTPLAHIIPPLSLSLGSRSLAQCVTVALCICLISYWIKVLRWQLG